MIDFQGGNVWSEPTDLDLFQIKFLLTDSGMQNSINIVKHFFQYINSLQQITGEPITKQYHTQFSLLSYLNFYYKEQLTTEKYVTEYQAWVIISV
jgi:secreted Zn-dependent insulinase-like peptidase